jgi:hypothetical protein
VAAGGNHHLEISSITLPPNALMVSARLPDTAVDLDKPTRDRIGAERQGNDVDDRLLFPLAGCAYLNSRHPLPPAGEPAVGSCIGTTEANRITPGHATICTLAKRSEQA